AYWRWYHRQLWISRRADLLLQVDVEQTPNWGSRVFLGEKRDALRRKLLVIDWRIRPDDVRVVSKVGELLQKAWRSASLRHVAELRPTSARNLESIESLYDAYHPTGTLRMGLKPEVSNPSVTCPSDDKRSEEHTSELQSLAYLVCRLLLEKKKKK